MDYYVVSAKCGHVGKNNYYRGKFYVYAENGSEAASVVRNRPRVKHDHKNAILDIKRITFEEYIKGYIEESHKPYYMCTNKQQQLDNWDNIKEDVYPEVAEDSIRTKKHSLKWVYNTDPLYEELRHFHGSVSEQFY